MNDYTSGNVPQDKGLYTIDAAGNVIPRPYGVSRWAAPRVRICTHEDCEKAAKILSTMGKAHNCCQEHEEFDN